GPGGGVRRGDLPFAEGVGGIAPIGPAFIRAPAATGGRGTEASVAGPGVRRGVSRCCQTPWTRPCGRTVARRGAGGGRWRWGPRVGGEAPRRAGGGRWAARPRLFAARPPPGRARAHAARRGGGLQLLPPLLHGPAARGRLAQTRRAALRRVHAGIRHLPVVPL